MVRSRDPDSQTRRCRVEHDIRGFADERCPIRPLKLKMTVRGHIYYVCRLKFSGKNLNDSCKVGLIHFGGILFRHFRELVF